MDNKQYLEELRLLGEEVQQLEEKNCPTNPSKWSYYKSQAKKKFDVYPSAYANGWASKQYKAAGGGWKQCAGESMENTNENFAVHMMVAKAIADQKVKNPETKKDVRVTTALKDKQHPAHGKAKSLVQRLKDKFSKKESIEEGVINELSADTYKNTVKAALQRGDSKGNSIAVKALQSFGKAIAKELAGKSFEVAGARGINLAQGFYRGDSKKFINQFQMTFTGEGNFIESRNVKVFGSDEAHFYMKVEFQVPDNIGGFSTDVKFRGYEKYKFPGSIQFSIKQGKVWAWYRAADTELEFTRAGAREMAKLADIIVTAMDFPTKAKHNTIKQFDPMKVNESVNEGKKRFRQQDGIGKAKYTISYHDGKQKHKDGSDFFGIQIFKNKKDLETFRKSLLSKGYVEESVNEAQKVNPTSSKFLKGMKKIKVKGLGGYMPGVDYVYVDGDKYYFVDTDGDHMELKNTATIKQLHKLHGSSLGEQINEWKLQLDLGKVNPSEFENWASDSLQKKHKIKVSGSGKNWTIVGKGNDDRMGSSADWISQLLGKAWTGNKIKVVQKESVNEASRRATDFYGDSKHGKSIHSLLKGKWDSKKVENYLEKLGSGNDVKYARIIDFISKDVGLDIRKYKTIGDQLPDLMKKLEVLYKDFLTESINEAASRTAMEIGGLTGMNKDAIQKFVDDNNLDIEKVYQYVKNGKLPERMALVSAIAGKPGNAVQTKLIKKFK